MIDRGFTQWLALHTVYIIMGESDRRHHYFLNRKVLAAGNHFGALRVLKIQVQEPSGAVIDGLRFRVAEIRRLVE